MVKSAGILAYSRKKGFLEFLIVHPASGPYFKPGDDGWWSIPKGLIDSTDESILAAAIREFQEEIGTTISFDKHIELNPVTLKSGKLIYGFAVEMEVDITNFKSNNFKLEHPKGSGIILELPELDNAAWVDTDTAKRKLNKAQAAFIDDLISKL